MNSAGPESPLYVMTQRHPERAIRVSIRVISMLAELHKVGFQRLRGMPYMSASGCYWRFQIGPTSIFYRNHGAWASDSDSTASVTFSSSTAETGSFFGWAGSAHDSARNLAAKFVERLPHIAELRTGWDYACAGWFQRLLSLAEKGWLAEVFSDSHSPSAHGIALIDCRPPDWRTCSVIAPILPLPPPGERPEDAYLSDVRA
jgi:hypothetical protein